MADPRDPFRVLSLPYDADADDVRRAFRRRARETHPDRGGTTAAFHEVRTAYRALADDLAGARRRWQSQPGAPRFAAGLDPRTFPTCTVVVGRRRDGRQTVAYDLDGRPPSWQPGSQLPPGGTCVESIPAVGGDPAFGVWVVPMDARRARHVFGPPAPTVR